MEMPKLAGPDPVKVAQHNVAWKAIQSLLGGDSVEYSQDPNTGQMTANTVKQKPGAIFRHILAGAILGGAAGSGGQTFAQGAARGAGAGMQNAERQDELARQRARQQATDIQQAQRNQREEQAFLTEQEYRKAATAAENAKTYEANLIAQNTDYEMHDRMVKNGAAASSVYSEAGVEPTYKDISEDKMHQLMASTPGAVAVDWEPTGMIPHVDKDGRVIHQLTYSGYETDKKVPLTASFVKSIQDSVKGTAAADRYADLKPGREVSVKEMMNMKGEAQSAFNLKMANDKAQAELDKEKGILKVQDSEIARNKAEANHANAEAAKSKDERSEAKTAAAQSKAAWANLEEAQKKGGSLKDLSAGDVRTIAADSAKAEQSLNTQLSNMVKANEQDPGSVPKDQIDDVLAQLSSVRNVLSVSNALTLKNLPQAAGGVDAAKLDRALTAVGSLPPDKQIDAIKSSQSLSDAEKQEAIKRVQSKKPAAPNATISKAKSGLNRAVEIAKHGASEMFGPVTQ